MALHKPLLFIGEGGVIRHAIEGILEKRMGERGAYCATEWINPVTNKAIAGRAFQARLAMGKFRFPKHKPWTRRIVEQCVGFPGARFDDAFDVCAKMGMAIDKAIAAPAPSELVDTPQTYGYRRKRVETESWRVV
jgi:hypothetical protein